MKQHKLPISKKPKITEIHDLEVQPIKQKVIGWGDLAVFVRICWSSKGPSLIQDFPGYNNKMVNCYNSEWADEQQTTQTSSTPDCQTWPQTGLIWNVHSLIFGVFPIFSSSELGDMSWVVPHAQDAIVTTRIIICLVGDPYKPSFPSGILGGGGFRPIYVQISTSWCFVATITSKISSWWLNQPIWKICASQIGSFPR